MDDLRARLVTLPDPLPAPPDRLAAVRLDGDPWRPPATGMSGARPAAVLVLIAPDAVGDARVVLIERASYDGHHSGEISFPGGAAEQDDGGAAETAVREAVEEIGLDPAAAGIRVIGELESFGIPVSDFRVTPVVAIGDRLGPWSPDPREVATVIEAPLAGFLPGAPITISEREIRGRRIRYGGYVLPSGSGATDGLVVWGATARILGQLGAVIEGSM